MSSSESLPNLHASIQQLIADAVRQTRSSGDDSALHGVLQETLTDLESQQTAMAVTIERLRAALAAQDAPKATPADEPPLSIETVPTVETPTVLATDDRGAHELDVIAHGASLANASGLQAFLREMPAVDAVQTRQFVNGELRLHAEMKSALDRAALGAWLDANEGKILTVTDTVVEMSFG
ncbi:MAG: hypothetical protein KC435_11440 [Thermomicrobiales bacterium]|nr:hypothetical protein [Thermomicrobiales bacterium]